MSPAVLSTSRPGRYCVIPFTNVSYTEAKDYVLHFHYRQGSVELEVEDVIAQQLSDDVISDDGEEEEYPEDPDEDELTDEQIDERDKRRAAALLRRKFF